MDEEEGKEVIWEWVDDYHYWMAYGEEISEVIETAFQSGRECIDIRYRCAPESSDASSLYTIQFTPQEARQINMETGVSRPVRRRAIEEDDSDSDSDEDDDNDDDDGKERGRSHVWEWWSWECGEWVAYEDGISSSLEEALNGSQESSSEGRGAQAGYMFFCGDQLYMVEYQLNGFQINKKTGSTRSVRRRKVCNRVARPSSPVSDSFSEQDEIPTTQILSKWKVESPGIGDSFLVAVADPPEDNECAICRVEFDEEGDDGEEERPVVELSRCHHLFHKHCIQKWFSRKSFCPICMREYDIVVPDQPPGTMEIEYLPLDVVRRSGSDGLLGYPGTDIIKVTYTFEGAMQGVEDGSQGPSDHGRTQVTFLPYTQEGEEVLRLLRIAFSRGLLFRKGRLSSVENGDQYDEDNDDEEEDDDGDDDGNDDDNEDADDEDADEDTDVQTTEEEEDYDDDEEDEDDVVLGTVCQKTSMNGGPNGYPDHDYFRRVKAELAALGVV